MKESVNQASYSDCLLLYGMEKNITVSFEDRISDDLSDCKDHLWLLKHSGCSQYL